MYLIRWHLNTVTVGILLQCVTVSQAKQLDITVYGQPSLSLNDCDGRSLFTVVILSRMEYFSMLEIGMLTST